MVWCYITVLLVVVTPVLPTPLRDTVENCRAVLPHMTLLHRSISSLLRKMVSNLFRWQGMVLNDTQSEKLQYMYWQTHLVSYIWYFFHETMCIHLLDSVANRIANEKSQLKKVTDSPKLMFIRKSRRAARLSKQCIALVQDWMLVHGP